MAFVLLLFVIIVLHELGHALAARKYGIKTQDITLLPIGGVARLEKMPEDPRQELVVALAGPAVNMVIAAGLLVGIVVRVGIGGVTNASVTGGDFAARMLWVNVWLAFFNLLPAFPMDGGRVLRALLAMRIGRERATEVAVNVGHAMALIFGFIGFFTNPFLMFIALFVWVGADGELQQVRMNAFLRGIPVSQVMAQRFETVNAETPLTEVARRLVPGFQSEFPVMQDARLLGFLGLEDVVRGLSEAGSDALAGSYARTNFVSADPDEALEDVVAEWQPGSGSVVAVIVEGRLVGIVTPANVGEHVMVKSALMRSSATPPPRPFRTPS
jgi:Zn-dependent protease/CBS domain-containing protein